MSLLFNMLPTFIIVFLPRSKRLLISWLQSPSVVILEPRKIKSDTVSTVSRSISNEVLGPDTMIFDFWMLSFKPTFSLSSFTFIKKLFSASSLSTIWVVSPAYLRLLIFLLAVLIPAYVSSRDSSEVKWKSLSCVWLFVTPWSIQFMEFSRPEYWSGKPFPSPGDLPNPGIEPKSPTLQADSLPAEPLMRHNQIYVWTFFRSCFKQTISTKMFLRHLEKTEHGLKIHREYIRNILIIKYLLFFIF